MDATAYPASFLDVSNSDRRPMTQDESMSFMSAVMVDMKEVKPGDFEPIKGTMPYSTIVHRLQSAGIELTTGALLVMLAWSDGRPGDMVMWAYTAACIARTSNTKLITSNDFIEAFPFGIPNDSARNKIWDAQKIPADKRELGSTDNYLDEISVWS